MEATTVFWISALWVLYTYAGYPLLLRAWSRCFGCRLAMQPTVEPRLSILLVAHNEARLIKEKIENLLALDYPPELLEIVIASDASSDETAEIARHYCRPGFRVFEFPQRRGKPAVLNELVPLLDSELVVLMDTRQQIESSALRSLVANFSDPHVGAVSGELMLHQRSSGAKVGHGIGFYWRYEKFIRLNESCVDSTVGVTGAFYAIRKKLFTPIPANTVLDDVLIPMNIVRQGYRVLFEPEARAHDHVPATKDAELTRKARTIAGNFQLLFRELWLLNPFLNRLWFQTVSHKFCRLLAPLCLALVFASNLLLLDSSFYFFMLMMQVLFYGSAIAGLLNRNPERHNALVNVASAFCLLNWATVLGFYRFARGSQQVTWQKAH